MLFGIWDLIKIKKKEKSKYTGSVYGWLEIG